jgi:membrane protein
MRRVITASVGGVSIYGPLAAPIVVTVWLYLIALAVLIGAAVNAAIDHVWPDGGRSQTPEAAKVIELRDTERTVEVEEHRQRHSNAASD